MEVHLEGTLVGHQNPIFTLESSSDPRYLFTGGNDKGVVEWDLKELKFKRILCAVPASVYALHLIPGTDLLAIGLRSGDMFIINTKNQELVRSLKVEKGAIFDIKTLLSKKELIAIGEEGYAYVWHLDTFDLLYRFKISGTTVRVISTEESSAYICFGDKEGQIHTYDKEDFSKLSSLPIHTMPVTSLLMYKDKLYSGGRDAKLNILSLPELELSKSIVPHMFTVYDIAKHPSKEMIATVSRDKTTKIWDIDSLKLLRNVSRDRKYDAHYLSINACLWTNYNDWLISVSDDKLIKIWSFRD